MLDHLDLVRTACTGRDRFRLYRRAFRFAAAGGIAICERYPSRESWALSGPSEAQGHALAAQSALATSLRRWERSLYERMQRPDLLFLLSLDAETAVSRKPSEPADYVRERARLAGHEAEPAPHPGVRAYPRAPWLLDRLILEESVHDRLSAWAGLLRDHPTSAPPLVLAGAEGMFGSGAKAAGSSP